MPYKDRTVGLIAFGILTILLGICSGGLLLLTLVGQAFVPQDQRVDTGTLLPAFGMYGGLGIALIVLGHRLVLRPPLGPRAAVDLFVVVAGPGRLRDGGHGHHHADGHCEHARAALPASDHAAAPTGVALGVILGIMFAMLGFFGILLPGIWVFFYMSPHVKATCETRDPAPSWTDRCPLPVLGLSLWMWFCVPMMLLMPFSGHLVLPLFGMLIYGTPGIPRSALFSRPSGPWRLAHLSRRHSRLVARFHRHHTRLHLVDPHLFAAQHDRDISTDALPAGANRRDPENSECFNGHSFVWVMVLSMVPFFGYLLFIRRYFSRQS